MENRRTREGQHQKRQENEGSKITETKLSEELKEWKSRNPGGHSELFQFGLSCDFPSNPVETCIRIKHKTHEPKHKVLDCRFTSFTKYTDKNKRFTCTPASLHSKTRTTLKWE